MSDVSEASGKAVVQVAQFRKNDFADLEAWADEMGISTDDLASQIVGRASRFLAQRKHDRSNVVMLKGKV